MEDCKSTFDIKIEKFLDTAKYGYEVIDGITGKTMRLNSVHAEHAEHNELTVSDLHQMAGSVHWCATVSLDDITEGRMCYDRGESMTDSMLEDDPLFIRIMDMIRYNIVEPKEVLQHVQHFLGSLGTPGEDWEFSTEDVASASFTDIRRTMVSAPKYTWRRLVVHWRNAPEGKLWFVLYPSRKGRAIAALCDDTAGEFVSAVTDLFAVLSEMDGMCYGSDEFNKRLYDIKACIQNIAKFKLDDDTPEPLSKLPGEKVEGMGILDDSILDMMVDGSLIPIVPPKRTEYGAISALYDVSNTHTGWDCLKILSFDNAGEIEWTMNFAGPEGKDIHRTYVFDKKSSKKLYRTMSLLVEAK